MKKIATIIGLVILFLFQFQGLISTIELLNKPDTLLVNIGIILFGIELFLIILLLNYSNNLIIEWRKASDREKQPEEVLINTPPKKKKRNYYKPKKKPEFPIKDADNVEKKSNLNQ